MAIAPTIVDHQHRGLPHHGPFGDPPFDVRGVTLHYTAGGVGVPGVIDTLLQRGLAYHYVITRDGVVHRLVDPRYRVSHAGSYLDNGKRVLSRLPKPPGGFPNRHTIAMSFDNAGYQVWPSLRAASAGWPVHRDPRTGLSRRWQPYTEAQLQAGAQIVADVLRDHDLDSSRIYTHQQFSLRKTDPGPAFPMARFKRMVSARRGRLSMLATLAPRLSDASTMVSSALVAVTTAMLGTAALRAAAVSYQRSAISRNRRRK